MGWYDRLVTNAIGTLVVTGGACGTFKGIEYLINRAPQSVIGPQGSLSWVERMAARGTEGILALIVGTGMMYLTQRACDEEWLYNVRTWCAQELQGYMKKRAIEEEEWTIEEKRIAMAEKTRADER